VTVPPFSAVCSHRDVDETGVQVEKDLHNPMRSKRRVFWVLGRCRVCGQEVKRPFEVKATSDWQRAS